MSQTRRLAAILAADVAGYSRLIGADEDGTLERLRALRRELLDPKIAEHRGRLVKTTGDGLLVEFGSVVDALRCAVEVQREMAGRNTGVPADSRIEFRIGINMGDIVVEDGDIFGDGVNVAARLEGLAEPGGICVSARVQEDAAASSTSPSRTSASSSSRTSRGRYGSTGWLDGRPAAAMPQASAGAPLPDKPSIAVLPFANMSGDPEQEYFADGMVEEIITALSRIRWLFVIARNSTFHLQGPSRRREAGRARARRALRARRLGAQSRQSGAHHRAADRCAERDASLGRSLRRLARRCLRPSGQGGIERRRRHRTTLQAAETARSANRPTNDLTAYDLYLRALRCLGHRKA